MSDADLIYNACLRAERRLEEAASKAAALASAEGKIAQFMAEAGEAAIRTLREEIGNGLAKDGR